MKRLTAIVYGRVQGVSFRHYTRLEAQRLGLVGWVANRPDGAVQVVAEGDESALNQLAAFLQQGPAIAHVTEVVAQWQEATGEFSRFDIRW
ncbi:MAG: acylphosphatase [Chloroflexi bacterium]|nr:acylphosphatase [Ardenticatenaceae bacterium]MBL1130828.1 acylphosphatase [Chloroflexota bacterium]NOG36925.1 acylphosphatase [Chloroflexota bacterium]GIK57152.1 MAG: acylphosphatase [Chloroflexota bacterium]